MGLDAVGAVRHWPLVKKLHTGGHRTYLSNWVRSLDVRWAMPIPSTILFGLPESMEPVWSVLLLGSHASTERVSSSPYQTSYLLSRWHLGPSFHHGTLKGRHSATWRRHSNVLHTCYVPEDVASLSQTCKFFARPDIALLSVTQKMMVLLLAMFGISNHIMFFVDHTMTRVKKLHQVFDMSGFVSFLGIVVL